MINFPDSPTVNQVFSTAGRSWKWDNMKWVVEGGTTSSSIITVADNPPMSPVVGNGWWDSVGGQLYIWVNDGSSTQWVSASNEGGITSSSSITVSDNPPLYPDVGDGWWDGVSGQLFIRVNDGTSIQWVAASNKFGPGTAGISTVAVTSVSNTTSLPTGTKGLVLVNNSTSSPITITLPPTPGIGHLLIIKDDAGNSEAYPITISGSIDGASSVVLSFNRSWVNLIYSGTYWIQT